MRVVPSPAAIERAREVLAGRSRLQDTILLAAVVVAVADGKLVSCTVEAPIEPPLPKDPEAK